MFLSRFTIKLAYIGNIALLFWIILELFKVPLHFIPGAEGPAALVTYLFGLILLGLIANIVSVIILGLHIFRGQKIPHKNIATFNFVFFFIVLLYYAIV